MKYIIKITTLFLLSFVIISSSYADVDDDAESNVDAIEIDRLIDNAKDTINSGQESVSKSKNSNDIKESNSYINSFGGNKNSISGFLDSLVSNKPMKTLNGTKEFNGQILCDINTEIGRIKYNKDISNKISMQLDLDTLGSKTISNISSICSEGVQSRTATGNYGYSYILNSAGQIDVTARPDLQDCRCIDSSCRYSATEDDYAVMTTLVMQFLSKTRLFDVVTTSVESSTASSTTVKLSSQNMGVCGSPNVSDKSYGYTPTNSLYKENTNGSVNYPDGNAILMDQLGNENSIVSLLNKSTEIEYETGVKIGSANIGKCSIKNSIVTGGEQYISDGGCSFNIANCSSINKNIEGYSECINYYESNDKVLSVTLDNICGSYEVDLTTSPITKIGLILDGVVDADCSINPSVAKSFKKMKTDGLSSVITAKTCDNSSTNFSLKSKRYFKANRELSIATNNGCLTYSNECKIVNETICDDEEKKCIQTKKNLNTVALSPRIKVNRKYNDIDYTVEATGSAIILTSLIDGKVTSLAVENGYFSVTREYSCPNTDNKGLVSETSRIDQILGGINKGNYDDMKSDECFIPICLVTKLIDDTSVVNNQTGETRVELGNSLSSIDEVRSCETVSDTKYVCPVDTVKRESISKNCTCDTDLLLDGIGNTLAGLEVLRQMSDVANKQCGKK